MAEKTLQELQAEIDALVKQTGKTGIKAFDITNIEQAKTTLAGLKTEFREMSGDLNYIRDSFKDAVQSLSKQNTYLSSAKSALKSISNIASSVVEHRKNENALTVTQLEKLQHKAKLQFDELRLAISRGKLGSENTAELEEQLAKQQMFTNAVQETLDIEKDINKQIGLTGVGLSGLANAVSKLGFGDLARPFSEAIESTKAAKRELILNRKAIAENNKELEKLNKPLTQLTYSEKVRRGELVRQNIALISQNKEITEQSNKYLNILDSLEEQLSLTNLLDFTIGHIVDAFYDLDKAATEYQRITGQSDRIQAAFNTKLINSVDYLTAAAELTEQISRNASNAFSGETIATVADFKEQLGLSADQAGNLALIVQATGKDLDNSTEQLVDQVSAFNKANRSAVSQGKVLKDVANTSEAITVSLGANPAKLAAAASQAARLGMQLKDVDAIASSLLDFESSIEAELEAQLLTGKEINLAKAREYALTNQLDKLGQEIFENTADIAEFGQMNRIAQEAYAKSLGMTRDQLAKTAYLRALDANMTEDQAAAAANVRLEDMKRLEVQESINASISKIAQALAMPLEYLASMVTTALEFKGAIVGLISLFTAYKTLQIGILAVTKAQAVLAAVKAFNEQRQLVAAGGYNATLAARQIILQKELAKTVGIAAAWAIANPVKALVGLGVAAGVGTLVYSQMKDGVIDPKEGPVVSGEFGTVQLSPRDQIVAGTNLYPGDSASISTPSLSLEPLVAEIRAMKDELKGVLTSIRDREGNVYLDTDLVGKALVIGSTSI